MGRQVPEGGRPCFGFYTKRALVRNRPEKTFFHCVHVRGDSERRQILAYVDHFGCLRFVAWLSKNYERCAFSHCYAVNPVTGKELDLDIVLDINPAELAEIDDGGEVDYDEVARASGVLVGAWKEMDIDRARTQAEEGQSGGVDSTAASAKCNPAYSDSECFLGPRQSSIREPSPKSGALRRRLRREETWPAAACRRCARRSIGGDVPARSRGAPLRC